MIDYLRNLFVSWFNKLINWFSERRQKKEMNTKKKIPFDKNKHADDDRQKRISEGFQALDDGCKSIANLRAEIEMSQTESKTFKDNEPKVNNDLDAPVPANNNIKGNPLFQRDGVLNPSLGANAPLNSGCVANERNSVSVAMANGCVANERHYVSNNNLEENNMCMGGSKPKKEEPKLKVNRVGSMTVGPKIFDSSISSIKSVKYSNDENHINPNDLNNTFEYQDEKVQKAMKGENNKMGELINKKAEKIKQEIKKDMDDKFAESTNKINQIQEQVNKNTEDMKEVNKKVDKIQEEQIDIKKMLAELKEENKDNKIRIANQEKMLAKMDEDRKIEAEKWREHDAKWMEIFGPYLKKKPRSSRNDNRESTNTSFSSFRGYMNMNNSPTPKMERADMAHSYDDNE